jgi:PAS domain S-box-containing protein
MSENCADIRDALRRTEAELEAAQRRIAELEARVSELEQRVGERPDVTTLAEERNLLRTLIDSVPDYIFVKDAEHRYLLNNVAHARAVAKLKPEQMVGHKTTDFFPSRMSDLFDNDEAFVLETGQPLIDRQEYFIGFNGQPFWHSTTKVPLKNLKGDVVGVVGITRDISERKRAEVALEQAAHKERELAELKARFIAMASHEFRTPLAAILSATELLQRYRNRLSDSQIEGRLKQIREQVMYLRDIMENALEMSRSTQAGADFAPQPADLDALCRLVVNEFCDRADVTHEIVYACESPPRLVPLDKNRMRQVIVNLVSNAIKYSPEDTTIRLTLAFTESTAVLRVIDQGIGIPEADQSRLFEMFHRASNVGDIGGTGLGLVITKQIVDLHGGTIRVQSKVGAGTTFTVELPLVAPVAAA